MVEWDIFCFCKTMSERIKPRGLSDALLRPLCHEGYEVHAMIKPIMKDPIFLAQKSAPATMLAPQGMTA